VAATFWLGARNNADDQWVLHSLEVRGDLTRVLSLVQSAETGQRGYLLTGRDAYLAPHQMAVEQLPPMLDHLQNLVSDNPQHLANIAELRRLIGAKLEELRGTIEDYKAGRSDTALATINSDNGFRLMQEIRDLITAMQATEDGLLAQRQQAAESSSLLLQFGVVVAFLLICGVGLLIVRYTRTSFAALSAARDRLALSNRELLDQVARREATEHQLRQAQKMEALGQLTGGIAHDFNNMLGVIMGAHDLVARRIKKGDFAIERFFTAAMTAAERAATLTQRLLAFARQQPLSPQPLDVNKMIVGMSDLLQSTLGELIHVETVAAAGLWIVHADSQQLENAILNIAINARDAMPEGGKLTIETANTFLDEAYCRQNPEVDPGQFAMVAVTDTGSGMAPDVMERAFDPFFTTKETGKGTGLGLSQVYGFSRQSSRLAQIESELDQGTVVNIYLPRQSGAPMDLKEDHRKPLAHAVGRESVLVVEDDDAVRAYTAEILRELGYSVAEASSAKAALAILRNKKQLDLLLTDVVMPGDMNGRELADEAAKLRSGLRVLFMTGYSRDAIIRHGRIDPGVHIIGKPFSFDDLAAKVRGRLDAAE
jgi:signal transduction histidine kinase/ActR/RegA family two-component response regulator